MPPRSKITKDMIVEAAFQIAREHGAEQINARALSERLGCSTQPVMWHFKTIADIKKAAYEKANSFHTAHVMYIQDQAPMKAIGLNYIHFAATEPNLFRFLFQSDGFSGMSFTDLLNSDELTPIYTILSKETKTGLDDAKQIFKTLFLYVHGYASMLANNSMTYDPDEVAHELGSAFAVAISAVGTVGAVSAVGTIKHDSDR